MADTQVKNETELTSFDGDEVFYLVDDPAGTPADRKAQLKNTSPYFGFLRSRFYSFTDCVLAPESGMTGDWSVGWNGAGALVTTVAVGSANAIGIYSLDMGTSTGKASLSSGALSAVKLGGGIARFQAKVAIPVLSDNTDTFQTRIGFQDNIVGTSTDAVYFRYTNGTNSGKWEAVARSNSTETTADTGVAPVAATYALFRVEVNAAGNSATFYINGTLVATITTNIPTGSGRELGYGVVGEKTAGTNARSGAHVDFAEVEYLFTTRR